MSVTSISEIQMNLSEELLSIEVNTHCNINCRHCFVKTTRPQASLSLDTVKEIIQEGHALGYRRLHVTGGEPLLWDGLFDALDEAYRIGYESTLINTNGMLLSDSLSKRIAAYDNLMITISLEGSEKLHNSIRGENNHIPTLQGIENALKADIGTIIFTTACKSLVLDLPDFVYGLFKEFPAIDSLTLIPLISTGNDTFPLSDELLDSDDYIKLVKTIAVLNALGMKVDILNDPLVKVVANMLERPWVKQARPMDREGSLIVMADKRIGVSHFSYSRFGNYRNGMLRKILYSDTYQNAVKNNETVCPACRHHEFCTENDMIRPCKPNNDTRQKQYFCIEVLDRIIPRTSLLS